jgi:hypothetical protein
VKLRETRHLLQQLVNLQTRIQNKPKLEPYQQMLIIPAAEARTEIITLASDGMSLRQQ